MSEEIIEKIEKIIKHFEYKEYTLNGMKVDKAIQGLLDLYNKEKEQNNCLINEKNIYKDLTKQAQEDVKIWRDLYNKEKEKNKKMFNQYEKRVNELEREIAINSVSKDKIREIIKDLEEFDTSFYDIETLKLVTKNTLQELLEERN